MLSAVVRVEPGEGRKLVLSFLHFFFLLLAYHFLKPVRSSLVIFHHGAAGLPKVYFVTAAVVALAVWAYNGGYRAVRRDRLLAGSALFFAANLLGFWALLRAGAAWAPLAFYVWAACFSVIAVNQFWSFANDLYDSRQAKRLYGFMTVGGELGAAAGSFLSARLASVVGTEALILAAAAALLPVAALIALQHRGSSPAAEPRVPPDTGAGGLALVAGSPYLRAIALLVLGVMAAGAFIDYSFVRGVEAELGSKDAMTAHFGKVYGSVSLIALGVQLLATSRLQRGLGVTACLLVLPVLCMGGALAYLARPTLAVISGLEVVFRALEYSLNRTTRELLYLPTAREVKYRAKAVIDMVVYRLGDAVGATGILACLALGAADPFSLGLLNAALLAAYAALVFPVSRGYVAALREAVQARAPAASSLSPGLEGLLARDAPADDATRTAALLLASADEADRRLGREYLDNVLPCASRRALPGPD